MLVFLSASAGAATGLTEDFNDNTLTGWGGEVYYVLTEENQELRIDADKVNNPWASFTYSFATLDLSSNSHFTVKVKADTDLNIGVSVWDTGDNYSYPVASSYLEIVASDDYEVYSFNYSGISGVDLSQIKRLNFVFNPVAPGAKATVYFDDLKIGSDSLLTPSITEIPTQNHIINAPEQEVFFRGVSDGADGTSGIAITATSSNTGLIPNPTVDYTAGSTTGYLIYTPVADQTGTANIAVTVSAPAAQTDKVLHFDVEVEKNIAPRIYQADDHDAKAGDEYVLDLAGIDDGNPNGRQAIAVTAGSSNTGLIPVPAVGYTSDDWYGTLTYTPTLGQTGTATITVYLQDDGGTIAGGVDVNQMSFNVSVYEEINGEPTIDSIDNVSVLRDVPEQTVALTGISDGDGGVQTITITASSSDANVIPTPTIVYTSPNPTGELRFTPAAGQTGTATVTVTVSDDGGAANNNGDQSAEVTFDIQVRVPPITGFEDDFEDGIIDPAWLETGEGAHTCTEEDGMLKIVVDKVATGNKWAGLWYAIPDELDISENPYISITMRTDNPADMLIFLWDYKDAYNTGGTVTYSVGTTFVEYFFDFTGKNLQGDGEIVDFSRIKALLFNFDPGGLPLYQGTFYFDDLRVGDKAHVPFVMPTATIDPAPDAAIAKSSPEQTVNLTGITDGNDGTNPVTLSAQSSNTSLIPTPAVSSVVDGNATLTYTPNAGATGQSTITVTASAAGSDDGSITFDVDVVTVDAGSAVTVDIDLSVTHQEIDGFGAYFHSGSDLLLDLAKDIGMSMPRFGVIGTEFEPYNDNSDASIINLDALDNSALPMNFMKRLKEETDIEKYIVTMWSPPAWMKKNKCLSAVDYATDNILQPYFYAEYAESMVALIKAVKNQTGIDLYAVSLQNEPQFNEPYSSCVILWEEYADLVAVVGPIFEAEGITTKLFFPEALQAQGRIDDYIHTLNADPIASQYMDIVAVHNYDEDGINVGGPGAQGWMDIWSWAQETPAKPTWMTETSGHANNWDGALTLAGNLYNALHYGNASAWVFWSFAVDKQSEVFGLVVANEPSSRYYVSKQIYKFVRPGAMRVDVTSSDPNILALAFSHAVDQTVALVLTNRGTTPCVVNVTGSGLPSTFASYTTAEYKGCEQGLDVTDGLILLPTSSVTTLYGQMGQPGPPAQASNPSPADAATGVSTYADLSWTAAFAATSHDVYFGTTSPGDFQGNQPAATFDPGTLADETTYYWRIDEKNDYGTTTGIVWSFTTGIGGATGTILRQWWTDISGTLVSDLTSSPDYPDNPSGSNEPTSFEAPTDWADNYGTRMRGYVYPPTTGDYTFWIASDDYSELWLSTDDNPANAVLIANVPGWTNSRIWDSYPEQQSSVISLNGGQGYYIEALHKEGGGGDNLAVAWQGPGISQAVIDGAYLSPWTGGAPQPPGQASNPNPADAATDVGIDTDLSWTAGAGADSHDVYFGTTSPGEFQGNQPAATFDPGTLANDTIYYWRIDEVNANGTTTGVVWSFTTESAPQPPQQATNPSPADGATSVDINADLGWTAGAGADSHDVYFGTTSPGTFQGNQPGTTFDPGTLANDVTYYWRIDEKNAIGTTTGVVWSFTTEAVAPPGQATNPSPADAATDVSINADLSWTAGSGADSHDVYFGTTSPGDFQGNQPATTFDPGTLANDTTYYWRIDEVNAGDTTTGVVWSFTTESAPQPPEQATNPNPGDGATGVSVDADLSWTAGSGATSHDVYFGTTSPGAFQGNQPAATFDPGTLANDTTYYWRIDEVNANGTTTGVVWSFTTESAPQPPGQATNPSPADGATGVNRNTVSLSWTAGTGATSHDVYFGTTSPGTFQGNQTGTTFDPGRLAKATWYYWRIDEVNASGTTTGVVWSFKTK